MCEKPLATTEAEAGEIREAVTAAGIPLVVGAMHAYDPGWLAALDACAGWLGDAHTIRSTILLPFNDRFQEWATETANRPEPPPQAAVLLRRCATHRRHRGLSHSLTSVLRVRLLRLASRVSAFAVDLPAALLLGAPP